MADWVGETIDILSERGRKLSDDAAEGLVAYVRHCDGGVACATNARDLIAKFPSNVADDSTESVKTEFRTEFRGHHTYLAHRRWRLESRTLPVDPTPSVR